MNETTTLGQRIQAGRKAAQLSQEALGEQLNVSRQAVSKWESDAGIPELENLIAMSRIFGISVGHLLGVEPETVDDTPSADALTEKELAAVEAIAQKYAVQVSPAPRSRWVIPALLAALIFVFAVFQWHTNQKLTQMQGQIDSMSSDVFTQIGDLSGQMQQIVNENGALIAGANLGIKRCDWENQTVTLSYLVAPTVWSEDTSAVFTATLEDGQVLSIAAQQEGEFYKVSNWTLPMDVIQFTIIFTTDNGMPMSTSTYLSTLDLRQEALTLDIQGNWRFEIDQKTQTVNMGAFDLTIGRASAPSNIFPLAAELCLFRNGESEPEETIPITGLLRSPGGYSKTEVNIQEQSGYETSFTLEYGEYMVTAIRVTDSNAHTVYVSAKVFYVSPDNKIFLNQVTDFAPGLYMEY